VGGERQYYEGKVLAEKDTKQNVEKMTTILFGVDTGV